MPVIAVDLGGTKLATALVSEEGSILFSETVQLEEKAGDEVAHLLISQVNNFLTKATNLNVDISSIGVCIPGIAYAKTGKVWVPNIPGWIDYPLLDALKSGVTDKSIEIKIDSDRACYILGEVWKGNAKNCSDAIFLSVGTGIGAGILANDKVLRGYGDIAGAIGWLALDKPFHEKYISCGCFEYNASGEGIAKVANEIAEKRFPAVTTRDVFEKYEQGDALAKTVIKNAIEFWGMAVANLVSIFNPEKIIFGGGVFGPALQFLDEIYTEARKWAQPISITQVKLTGSALGADAGLYGAAWLALKD